MSALRPVTIPTAVLILAVVVAACGSGPGAATTAPGNPTQQPVATTSGEQPTSAPVAGEPCSFLTSDEVAVATGLTPVEIKERAGRGDCDYFLNADKSLKVNVGVTVGPDGLSIFESTRGLGEPKPATLGDDAYSIFLNDIGTLVMVKKGDAVVAVQVLTDADADKQLEVALILARAVLART